MNFEEMVLADYKRLEEGFFRPKPSLHHEIQTQLAAHNNKPFIPSWAHKKMLELQDKHVLDKTVKSAPFKVVHPLMAKNIKNTGETRIGTKQDSHINTPIVLHNTRTGEMHLLAGNHKVQTNSGKIHTNTPVIAIPHEEE